MIGDKVEPYLRFKHDGKQYRGEIDMAKWPKDPVDGNINAASTVTRVTFADATQSYNFPGIDPFSQFIDNAPITVRFQIPLLPARSMPTSSKPLAHGLAKPTSILFMPLSALQQPIQRH